MHFSKVLLNALLQLLLLLLLELYNSCSMNITFNQSIGDGDLLHSINETFVLGFFSPGTSRKRYVVLQHGNSQGLPLWSRNVSASLGPVAHLLESGNLVLVGQQDDNRNILCQSFDHPTHVILSNMTKDDPGIGSWSLRTEPNGSPQIDPLHTNTKNSDKDADDLTRQNRMINLPRATSRLVKNKTPAPVQITAEQILREAREQHEPDFRPPSQGIENAAELADLRFRRREEFEDRVRGARQNLNLWIKYAEMEINNKQINHARNVLDRAVQYLPRVNQLWRKYIHMEEMIGNLAGARQVFEMWMTWMPEQEAWLLFVKFEVRYKEVELARKIFERFVQCHPRAESWIRYAKFEVKNGGDVVRARNVLERAVQMLADDEQAEKLFVALAEFEEQCKDTDRARCVYKLVLEGLPKGRAEDLFEKLVCYEKKYGDREGIDDAIARTKRIQYEEEVRKNPLDYDSWFDYIRLEENAGNTNRIREVYESAVANVPPANEKQYWKRYIYLWINYALYEELDKEDVERARQVYRECLNLIPHKKFSFAKIWILAAKFELRQLNLTGARQILGTAIGKAPKLEIFRTYIEIELQLGCIDRCRKLCDKYLLWEPHSCNAYIKYAEFERGLGETERARALLELAISQRELDNPELLWKQYAKFEAEDPAEDVNDFLVEKKQCIKRARRVFERALNYFPTSAPDKKEERSRLLEEWLNMESSFGYLGDVCLVQPRLPKKVKRRRQTKTEEGYAGYDEYIDYLFPEESETKYLKILEAAYQWNKKRKFLPIEDKEILY
ncbi:LOW QUALITY PROTEIN: uncharacterized protein LOC126789549 [Argentina anserina]|uniref:LOW QUALITY PROTEIN: uncharacterized protein LOC126789549 n=1 Tax=Argentina anserina TaxID=57926 RepID=UPI0021767C26|nr:LOW QUALITY PROTEIN: uncharacterized protein LOC126789549 [Potentilla anserina]